MKKTMWAVLFVLFLGAACTKKGMAPMELCSRIMDISIKGGDKATPEEVQQTNAKCAMEMEKVRVSKPDWYAKASACVQKTNTMKEIANECLPELVGGKEAMRKEVERYTEAAKKAPGGN